MRLRPVTIALLSGLLFASPATDIADGLSIDVLTALRWQVFGQRDKPEAAPTVVIVLDEEKVPHRSIQGLAGSHLDA